VAAKYLRTLRLFSHDLRVFLVTAVVVGLAWDGVRTVIFNLYLLRLDYDPKSIGLINAIGGLAFALMCIPAGALGTRYGSRRMLIAGLGLVAAGLFLLPVAELLAAGWRTAWLLATTFSDFAGLAIYYVNSFPFLMEATGNQERSHAFSVHIALVPMSAFAGSLLAGLLPGVSAGLLGTSLQQAAPYRFPLWLAGLLIVPGCLVLLPTRSMSRKHAPALVREATAGLPGGSARRVGNMSNMPYGLLIVVGLIVLLRFIGRGTVTTLFNVYLDDGLGASAALIGALSAIGQLLAIPAALLAPLLTARWGHARSIFGASLGMAVFLLPLALVPSWAAAGVGLAGSTAFFMMTAGPLRMFSQEVVPPRWRAVMASAFMLGNGLALSAASLAGGYIIAGLGYQALFLAAAGLSGAGALLFWLRFRSIRLPGSEPAPQPLTHAEE
jgi:MFS family permease